MPYQKSCFSVRLVLIFLTIVIAPVVAVSSSEAVVAWVAHGDLHVWQTVTAESQSIAAGDIIQPYLSPDNQHIAFTRGNALANALWVTDLAGASTRSLVSPADFSSEDATLFIGQVVWADASTILLNTVQSDSIGFHPRNDLWRVDVDTGAVQLLLTAGQGGAISVSPSADWVAVIDPGTYGDESGRIRLLNLSTLELTDVLGFPAVSSGSEYPFYPELFWETEGSAFRVAIPQPDLIYDETGTSSTSLWRVPVDGEPQQFGTLPASLFGQPRWSSDSTQLAYLQRVGDASRNQFALYIASGEGQNLVSYASGAVGEISSAFWLPESTQFIYHAGVVGAYWLGQSGSPPQQLESSAIALRFLDSTTYVYITAVSSTFELRVADLSSANSGLIATVENAMPVFDGALLNTG